MSDKVGSMTRDEMYQEILSLRARIYFNAQAFELVYGELLLRAAAARKRGAARRYELLRDTIDLMSNRWPELSAAYEERIRN